MEHLHPRRVEHRHIWRRVASSGFDDTDPAFDDRLNVFGVGRRIERRKKWQVHAERRVGHAPAALNLTRKGLGCALGQAGDDAETACVGNRRSKLCESHEMHSALDDRVGYAKQVGDPRPHLLFSQAADDMKRPPRRRRRLHAGRARRQRPERDRMAIQGADRRSGAWQHHHYDQRSEEHTSELQSLMRISYAVFCLKKKKKTKYIHKYTVLTQKITTP